MDELKPKNFSYPHVRADLDLCENQIDALCGARSIDEAALHVPAVETDFDMQFHAAFEELKAYRKTGLTPEELNRRAAPENNALTNADRIRSMSDEELTRFIQSDLPIFRTFGEQLNWLKQPAKEDK